MSQIVHRTPLHDMILSTSAPERPLPTSISLKPNRTFYLLVALVASLGLTPVIVAYLASTFLN